MAGQIEQMLPFGVVKLQRPRHRLQHRPRRPRQMAPLEPAVVVDAQPGEHGDLLPPQARNAPVPAVAGQAGLLRSDSRPAADQKVPDVLAVIHDIKLERPAPMKQDLSVHGSAGPVRPQSSS